MAGEKKDNLFERLVALLGSANVSRAGGDILAKPATADEIAAAIRLAREENRAVNPLNYRIGPLVDPGQGEKLVLSLERLNKIRYFNRQSLYLVAEPAVTSGEIAAVVASAGLHFPGLECQHRLPTIGENVAACFIAGEPVFQCQAACLCGLEMVLLNGEIITAGGNCLGNIGNYELSYILGAKSDRPAVITGIHLKVLPGEKSGMFLAAVLEQPEEVLAVLPALLEKHGAEIQRFVVAGASAVYPAVAQLGRFLAPAQETGAYALVALWDDCPGAEAAALAISSAFQEWCAGEVLLADATQQKEWLSFLHDALLAELKADQSLVEKTGLSPAEALRPMEPGRMKALAWQDGQLTVYYSV